jgi:ABC-2 type transport system permease protein
MPVSKLTLVVGATIASLVLNFLPMIVAMGFYGAIGWLSVGGDLLQIVLAVLVIVPFLLGFLMCFSAITVRFREAAMLVQVLRTIFSILCGLQFPLAVLPGWAQSVGRAIPLTHFVDVVRGVVLNGARLADYADSVTFVLVSGFAMIAVGALIFELVRRNVRSNGLVTGY